MAVAVHARLSPAEGRRFAWTVGAAFAVLAGLVLWRGLSTLAVAFAIVAGGLGVAGLLVPGHLGPVHRGWMALAHGLSRVTTPVFMAIIYFVVITPVGAALRLAGHRPLVRRARAGSYFVDRPEGAARRGDLRRQF